MEDEPSRSDSARVIVTLDDITPSRLDDILRRAGESFGSVVTVDVEPGETTFCVRATVRPVYAGAPGPARLFVKFTKPQRPVPTPDDGREVLFYRHVAIDTPSPSLVRCFDAVFDAERHRMHLVLEDAGESHYAEPPSHLPLGDAHAAAVVDALAQIHAAWWNRPPFEISGQPRPDGGEIETRIARVRVQVGEFLDMLCERLSPARHQLIRRALASLPRLYTRLLDPTGYTVVHDDVHVGNVLYPRDPASDTIRLIDWQTWLVDLAARVLRKLFLPPHLWATGHTPNIWWNHLQRVLLAFDDLGCGDLLED